MDGHESVDGQGSGPRQDLRFAAPAYQGPYPYQPYAPPTPPGAPRNPQATASLVLGIASLFLSLLFVPAILGVVLGIVGLVRSGRTDPPTGRGAAITGIALSVLGAALGVVLAMAAPAALADLTESISRNASAPPEDGSAESPAPDPKDFVKVDATQWKSIVTHPARAEGSEVVVFAEVAQFDSGTGSDRFLAVAGIDQPGRSGELRSHAVFVGEEPTLRGVEAGDVLKVHAVVTDAMELETDLGGVSTVPVLTVARIKDVGLADLSKDFALGTATRDQLGILSVPVTVTNSGGQTFTYSAQVVAESKDGKTSYDTGTAYAENIEPGRKAELEVDFFGEIPDDAVFRLEEAGRHIE